MGHAPTCPATRPPAPRRFGPLLQWQVAPAKLPGVTNLQYAIVSFHKLQDAQAAYQALHGQVRGSRREGCCLWPRLRKAACLWPVAHHGGLLAGGWCQQ